MWWGRPRQSAGAGNPTTSIFMNCRRSIKFISICGRSSRGSRTWRTRSSTSLGCGSTMSVAVSRAVAASKTEAAYERWAAALGCGPSAVPCTPSGCACLRGSP
jgi:hypothetical protein